MIIHFMLTIILLSATVKCLSGNPAKRMSIEIAISHRCMMYTLCCVVHGHLTSSRLSLVLSQMKRSVTHAYDISFPDLMFHPRSRANDIIKLQVALGI